MVIVSQSFILEFIILDVDNLFKMKYIINSLEDIPNQFLLKLQLHSRIGHQERIWNCYLNSFNVLWLLLGSVLGAVDMDYEVALFLWRAALEVLVRRVYHFVYVHLNHEILLLSWLVVVIGAGSATVIGSCTLRIYL